MFLRVQYNSNTGSTKRQTTLQKNWYKKKLYCRYKIQQSSVAYIVYFTVEYSTASVGE